MPKASSTHSRSSKPTIYANTKEDKDGTYWQCTNQKCRKWHALTGYVYAHYRDVLLATCDGCGTKHETQLGQVWRQQ